jgi:hypothetical protein
VHQAADRAAALTKQLVAFSRRQLMQVGVVLVNLVVTTRTCYDGSLARTFDSPLTKLANVLSNTWLDPAQLVQVILNLAATSLRRYCESAFLDCTYFLRWDTLEDRAVREALAHRLERKVAAIRQPDEVTV